MEMAKYRKKPVVIEAVQFDGSQESAEAAVAFTNGAGSAMKERIEPLSALTVSIKTLEGEMRADPGDWIIKGVKGEFYPCKPDIFAATYEPA
jgi:hypothetical protein